MNNETEKNDQVNKDGLNTNINEESQSKDTKSYIKEILQYILFVVVIMLSIGIMVSIPIIIDSVTPKNTNYKNYNYHNYNYQSEIVDFKPIIYLYPEQKTNLTVKLGNPEKLTCSYPKYRNTGWKVTAYPDGTLIDNETGRSLYSLYWEGLHTEDIRFNEGFCVKGEDTIEFLEEKLAILGLTEKEAEEFIVYWLPKMEDNKYNLIRFASEEEINKNMPLEFSEKPDTIIRVLMQFKELDEYENISEQKLITPERTGFVVVEWGGSIVN